MRQAIGQFEYQMTPLRWHFFFGNTDKLPILQNLVAMSKAMPHRMHSYAHGDGETRGPNLSLVIMLLH